MVIFMGMRISISGLSGECDLNYGSAVLQFLSLSKMLCAKTTEERHLVKPNSLKTTHPSIPF